MMNPKIIAFDADDTLWHNEPYFDEAQERFCVLFQDYASSQEILGLILNHQIKNLPLYGFGIKAFTLSMIESALELTNHKISGQNIEKVIQIGKDLLQKPVELLPNVESVLEQLKGNSGIGAYFHHIEVMSDKAELDYVKMLGRLDCKAQDFLMIGNSLKSDVLPVLNIGGHAIHIPYHTTWEYEKIDFEIEHENFESFTNITEILPLLK